MLIVIVDVAVRPESVEAFVAATRENARQSLLEPGIARFDLLADQADPTHFQLLEAYRTPEAPALHKQTPHYAAWREAVEPMMARARQSLKYTNLHPDDASY
jgi:quinol monooxygenase YgiN